MTAAARSEAWIGFARSSTGIVGSNPTQVMDVCLFSDFVVLWVESGLCDWLIPHPGSIEIVERPMINEYWIQLLVEWGFSR
jgi:hypothetical protein